VVGQPERLSMRASSGQSAVCLAVGCGLGAGRPRELARPRRPRCDGPYFYYKDLLQGSSGLVWVVVEATSPRYGGNTSPRYGGNTSPRYGGNKGRRTPTKRTDTNGNGTVRSPPFPPFVSVFTRVMARLSGVSADGDDPFSSDIACSSDIAGEVAPRRFNIPHSTTRSSIKPLTPSRSLGTRVGRPRSDVRRARSEPRPCAAERSHPCGRRSPASVSWSARTDQ
jgi:hypothetical protein